jgi:hypothetical protein
MIPFARILFALIVAFGVSLPGALRAEDISSADREAIRSMIESQIEAFRRDDASAAYGYAAPAIQGMYPSIDQFMAMVRSQYPPVYRPRSVTFGEFIEAPGGLLQKVFITGPDGENWVAVYSLERQPDGSWRISGCFLMKDTAPII